MVGKGAVVLLMSVVACGCAARAGRAHEASHPARGGDPDAPAALAVLPEMVREPADENERMHPALALAGEIFERKLPEVPEDRSYASLSQWVESAITPWVEERRDAIDDVRFQMLGRDPSPVEHVLSGAVVGLLQEDTALSLERIPPPSELDREPEIATMFRDIIRAQARPLVGSAVREYRKCEEIGASEGDELERWSHFCHARMLRLRAATDPAPSAPPAR